MASTRQQMPKENQKDIEEQIAAKESRQPKPVIDPRAPPTPEWEQIRNRANLSYEAKNLGYNPYLTEAGPRMQGMNYNPYRQAAQNQASSQAQNQFASSQARLQQTGGMSASDRMRAYSDFNRAKIQGQLGANQQANQLQSQNQLDVGRWNAQRDFKTQASNIGAQNDAAQYEAMANNRRNENFYRSALGERNLGRQLDAAQIIGNSQMNQKYQPGPLEMIWQKLPVSRAYNWLEDNLL